MNFDSIPDALTLPLRLKLLCSLVDGKKAFGELKELTGATEGNISIQLSKLEGWGYIRSEKAFVGKRPKSTYEITRFGIDQLNEYLDFLESVLR